MCMIMDVNISKARVLTIIPAFIGFVLYLDETIFLLGMQTLSDPNRSGSIMLKERKTASVKGTEISWNLFGNPA